MNTAHNASRPLCTATTAAGKACTYLAVPGSDPPLCELHSRNWLKTVKQEGDLAFYGRYLNSREKEATLQQMAQSSRVRELVAVRTLAAHLLDELIDAREDPAARRALVPLALRALKLASALAKDLQAAEIEDDWDAVLDRLSDELDLKL
jgi:hypothetical protein